MNWVTDRGLVASVPSTQALAMVEQLIGFATVSRDSNLGLIEFARDYLEHLGGVTRLTYDVSRKKANLFATLGEGRRPGLILSGHTDVVPVEGQVWDSDPFHATHKNGKLYGRGSADMKGFLGVALSQAPHFLASMENGRLDSAIHYALSYDEEIGCVGVRGLIRDLEEIGVVTVGCIVGEPTSMQPIIAHKGTHRFRCSVHGREVHSSFVSQGVNAIEFASRLIVFIRQLGDRLAQLETRDYGFAVPYTTLSTGVIRGGIAANIVPKDCEFQFDMRTLPSTRASDIHAEIQAYAMRLSEEMKRIDPDTWIDLDWTNSSEALDVSEKDALVQLTMKLARDSTVSKVSYGTEAGLFQAAGIPSVICGPGNIEQAHRPNEFVSLEQLAQCERFMVRLADSAVI